MVSVADWEKNAQCWGRALSFILGKMKTIAWEGAFRITPRNCPKEVEESSYIHDCGEGGVHIIKHIFFAENYCYFQEGYC